MKQTITELEIRTEREPFILEVQHHLSSIQLGKQEDEDSNWDFFEIPAEFCDSLIDMLQKRKELMG
jgi:hypothetical protein